MQLTMTHMYLIIILSALIYLLLNKLIQTVQRELSNLRTIKSAPLLEILVVFLSKQNKKREENFVIALLQRLLSQFHFLHHVY